MIQKVIDGRDDHHPDDYKRLTTETYDRIAADIGRDFDGFFETYGRLEADCLLETLDPGALILDLGCGTGIASGYFAQHGHFSVSADLSVAMVRECKSRGLSRIVRLDLEALPFQHACFDAIWAHTSLIHVPKERLTATLETVGRALKPGGTWFVALRDGARQGYKGQPGLQRWFSDFQQSEFEGYVPPGFDVVKTSTIRLRDHLFLNYYLVKSKE